MDKKSDPQIKVTRLVLAHLFEPLYSNEVRYSGGYEEVSTERAYIETDIIQKQGIALYHNN